MQRYVSESPRNGSMHVFLTSCISFSRTSNLVVTFVSYKVNADRLRQVFSCDHGAPSRSPRLLSGSPDCFLVDMVISKRPLSLESPEITAYHFLVIYFLRIIKISRISRLLYMEKPVLFKSYFYN